MPTRNINLTPHFDKYIESQVTSGHYGNASEIVRDALRLLEERAKERELKLCALRKAAKTGFDAIDQGNGIALHSKEEIDAFVNGIADEMIVNPSIKGKSRA
jgi:antitoxin ParD1/3/4